jgi:hypothetical protein
VQPYLGWIALGVALALILFLLWIYSDCVYRFILLETVITGECKLREGWRRWRIAGRRYLLWTLGFGFSALLLMGVVLGLPLLLAYQAGWFSKAEEHIGGLIGGGLLELLVLLVMIVTMAAIDLLARDFLIPVMAFEDVGAIEGWRRLHGLITQDMLGYTGYALMKVVLATGSAIIFAILNFIVVLIALIPIAVLGVAGYFIGKGANFSWDISAVLLVAAAALLAIAGILFLMGFVYAPGLIFFQSYTVVFFASRYSPLGNRIYPPVPPVPIPPPVAPATSVPPTDPFPLAPPDPSTA